MRGQVGAKFLVAGSVLALAATGVPCAAQAQVAPATSTPTPTPTPTPDASGPLRPYRGDIRSFWGDIRSFRGDIRSFWGDIRSFWGDIRSFNNTNNPFDTTSNLSFWGDVSMYNGPVSANAPAWSTVGDFWTNNGATLNSIGDSWNGLGSYSSSSAANYASVAQQLQKLLAGSATTWGSAVTAATGKSFNDGFVAPLLAKYGIDLSNPQTLANTDPGQFLFAYYDGLMSYSGRAHVDHWMKEADYTPAMTQQIGDGARSTIGVLDMAVSKDTSSNLTSFSPNSTFTTGHGDAVASLLVADPAKLGVMGMAPMAQVVTYNPFDGTGTAGWSDVQKGIIALSNAGAGVINASLGVPGWTLNEGWNQVFSNAQVAAATKNTIVVIAAGNDGTAQTQNIVWNFVTNPNSIVVGSTGTAGTISSFSNMPGTACLTALQSDKTCAVGNRLMDHFITAPGEMILVSDGNGGLTRMSGTSFAAPLVSGTIALLDDRWPWLANYPAETVSIVLKSARTVSDGSATKGGSTANATYGVGALDVGAALSPLDFSKVQFYTSVNGLIVPVAQAQMRSTTMQAKWRTPGTYFYVFENVGKTYRDFAIPMDSTLVNQTTMGLTGSQQQFQYYINSRLQSWMSTGVATAGTAKLTGFGFSEPVRNAWGMDVSMAIAPRTRLAGFRQSELPYQTALRFADAGGRVALTMGAGDGALVTGNRAGFGSASDYDPYVGGANPVLGFASGGAYGELRTALTGNLSLSTGFTQRSLRRDTRGITLSEQVAMAGIRPYEAQATEIGLTWNLGIAALTGTVTHLAEDGAILGEQSRNPADIAQGSATNGATVDARLRLSSTLSLDATGTVSRTDARGAQNYRTAGGLGATSWQVGLSKDHLLDRHDTLRLSLAQPLHVESGNVDYDYVAVIDRDTGELGVLTQRLDIGNTTSRMLVGEASYARTLIGGRAELRLFGRADVTGVENNELPAAMGGAGFRLAL